MGASNDWRLWCRLCGKEDPQGNVNLFLKNEQNVLKAIKMYLKINIHLNDDLPRNLCMKCYSLVISWTNFTERVPIVQQMFKDLQSLIERTRLAFQTTHVVEEREHLLLQQPNTEVVHCNTVSDLSKLNNAVESNPQEQSLTEFIKEKEGMLEEKHIADMEDQDTNDVAESHADVGEEDYDRKLMLEDDPEQIREPHPYIKEQMPAKDMPRTKSRPIKRKWEESNMAAAIRTVHTKEMGFKRAASQFKVPCATLGGLVKDAGPIGEVIKKKVGRPPILPQAIEEELVRYLLAMESKFIGFTALDVKRLAYDLAVQNKVEHPFKNETTGRTWINNFLRRYSSQLSLSKPTDASYDTANGLNRETVSKFFDLLEEQYAKHSFPSDRIYNVGETALAIVQSETPKIISMKGIRQVSAITSAERGSFITIICCMSASGNFIPPMMIFPRKNMTSTLMRGAPHGSLGRCHPSGWISIGLFTEWFEHFIEKTQPTAESPVMLILYDHYSHIRNLRVINMAADNNVVILSPPPHTAHKMQPIEISFMGPLKTYYSENVKQWMLHNNHPIGPYQIADLFGRAYVQCQTALIAINGFKASGIYPLNRNVFDKCDYIASKNVTANSTTTESCIYVQTGEMAPPKDQFVLSQTVVAVTGPEQKGSNRGRKSSEVAETTGDDPVKYVVETAAQVSPKTKKPICSVYDALARPKCNAAKRIKMQENKKKNVEKRSPLVKSNDDIFFGASTSAAARKWTNNSQQPTKEAPMCAGSDQSDFEVSLGAPPDDADLTCGFCGEKYLTSRKCALWIQCVKCEHWAHVECSAADRDVYVCDFCGCGRLNSR